MKTIVVTPAETVKDETIICNILFDNGMELLHLRKPGAGIDAYEQYIQNIRPCYRKRIVLHEHYELAEKHHLHGIHLKSEMAHLATQYPDIEHISISCHSVKEIASLPFRPAYCFLSPIFDSISKSGHKSKYPTLPDLTAHPEFPPVIALGGITPSHIYPCIKTGFSGVAVLGYLWEHPMETVSRFIRLKTPHVITIAGHDPTSGAGLTADIKTFEATGSYGHSICSALTYQNEFAFLASKWSKIPEMELAFLLVIKDHSINYLKIGLIESFDVLLDILKYIHQYLPHIKIIWDPILKSSTGKTLHESPSHPEEILKHLYLVTPNTDELKVLFGADVDVQELQNISRKYNLNILWKGGHNKEELSTDRLITPKSITEFSLQRSPCEKHGTGCAFSAAVTSYLAQGHSLTEASRKAQVYVSRLMESNETRLGYHFIRPLETSLKPFPEEVEMQYITDSKKGMTVCQQIEAVCRGGARWVQLRMKGASDSELLQEGRLAKQICCRYNARLIINDNVNVARQIDADGVHLGKEDITPEEARRMLGTDKIIGATCNTFNDIVVCHKQQVDYIGLGPFAYTATKKNLSPILGIAGYTSILLEMKKADITIPVFAIGGIQETDLPELMHTGIQGVALSGVIKNSEDMTRITEKIINDIKQDNHGNTFKNCR